MTDTEFIRALETCALPETAFGHAAHVRAAYLCLRGSDFPSALQRISSTLHAYTASLGKPGRYHETKTVAYMALIGREMLERGDGGDWPGFAQQNPGLLDPRLLLRFYTSAELDAPLARRIFLLPTSSAGERAQHSAATLTRGG